MGSNVERLLTDMERENQTFVSLRRLREAIRADREQRIPVRVDVYDEDGSLSKDPAIEAPQGIVTALHNGGLFAGEYTLHKRNTEDES